MVKWRRLFTGTETVISSDPSSKDDNVQFITIFLKKYGKYRCFSDAKRIISVSSSIASQKQEMCKYFNFDLDT